MAKKGGFSFEGMVDPAAQPAAPIDGVEQRGEDMADKPAAARASRGRVKAAPDPVAEPRKRGRPPKDRTATEARPSFGLDPQTHALFKIWLLRRGLSMQDYLEAHIRDLVKDER